MKLKKALDLSETMLAGQRDVESPALESEVLVRHVLKIGRVQLYLDLEKEFEAEQETRLRQLLQRRLKGEPLAYIIHNREFFGIDFYVDNRVLIPRPETEHLVEEALKYLKKRQAGTIADIGTGSGAIAVSLAVNLACVTASGQPLFKIYATDVSPDALEVAGLNTRKHGAKNLITLLQGDLLDPLPEPVDIIVTNLPYVKKEDVSEMPSAGYEPVSALDGGTEGLDQIVRLANQLKEKLYPGGCALLEIGAGQSLAVNGLLRKLYPSAAIDVIPDLAGIERVVKIILDPNAPS